MFTGLIQEIGEITAVKDRNGGREFSIRAQKYEGDLVLGESIACDGCCLTVEEFSGSEFQVFASPETLRLTTFQNRSVGDGVNLERALRMGDRLGGHMVSGHVDATGKFREAINNGDSWEVWIEAPNKILEESIPKGSITLDGISLTLVELTETAFSLWIIPETWDRTTLSQKKPGDLMNLESDMMGKYVRKALGPLVGEGREKNIQKLLENLHPKP